MAETREDNHFFNGEALTHTMASKAIPKARTIRISVQIVTSNGDSEGEMKYQVSNDGVNWTDFGTYTYAIAAGVNNLMHEIMDMGFGFLRLYYTRTAGDTSTVVAKVVRFYQS